MVRTVMAKLPHFQTCRVRTEESSFASCKRTGHASGRAVCASLSALCQIISGNGSCSSSRALRARDCRWLMRSVARAGIPLWAWWGGADVRERETDITIPITDVDRTLFLARQWYERGFRTFKMKVGKDVDHDIQEV